MKFLLTLPLCVINAQLSSDASFLLSSANIDSNFQTIEEAKIGCDKNVSCAGISSIFDEATNGTNLYAHSFLPEEMDTQYTYHSSRNFTIHSGRVQRGTVKFLDE